MPKTIKTNLYIMEHSHSIRQLIQGQETSRRLSLSLENLECYLQTYHTNWTQYTITTTTSLILSTSPIGACGSQRNNIVITEFRKDQYDKLFKTKEINFVTGDLVLLKYETARKMDPVFKGTFKVISGVELYRTELVKKKK